MLCRSCVSKGGRDQTPVDELPHRGDGVAGVDEGPHGHVALPRRAKLPEDDQAQDGEGNLLEARIDPAGGPLPLGERPIRVDHLQRMRSAVRQAGSQGVESTFDHHAVAVVAEGLRGCSTELEVAPGGRQVVKLAVVLTEVEV